LAASTERARLARELHDVVAHSLTVVVTLAEAAAASAGTDPPAARDAMGQVATTGRQALAEMRRLVGVLRTEPQDDLADLAPVRGLDGLDGLVAGARAAGLPVRLTVSGRPRRLNAATDSTAYRIVQESLTNVLKHASSPSAVDVLLRWEEQRLMLQVGDDGRSPVGTGEPGHGLVGMRERMAIFGGELSAGPSTSGGWRVRATLPLLEEPE
jgi:signal transduction histidine kinase